MLRCIENLGNSFVFGFLTGCLFVCFLFLFYFLVNWKLKKFGLIEEKNKERREDKIRERISDLAAKIILVSAQFEYDALQKSLEDAPCSGVKKTDKQTLLSRIFLLATQHYEKNNQLEGDRAKQ